jgi:hypothetical protein
MWRSKKFIITGVLVIIVLAAALGGVAIAQANDETTTTTTAKTDDIKSTLLDKVASIYQANTGTAIDPAELEKAFTQAMQEMRSANLDSYLQKLVDNGTITQEQADQWKTWLDARPDIPSLSGGNRGGMMFRGMQKGGFGLRFNNCWSDTEK